ncbi:MULTISPECIES: helicase associated domain-containing protein [Streptomyces]|uniref:helicase associated domain-containing protein n=1 Tax=Streptomyces TaxID=1883 RepID=UPI0029C9C643|nr:helicase associated domain-containing protein [Streptomyces sp. ID01-9D]
MRPAVAPVDLCGGRPHPGTGTRDAPVRCAARPGGPLQRRDLPGWTVDWQRHYAAARVLLAEEQGPADVLPGVTVNGCDVGTWVARQTDPAVWETLLPEQQKRLKALGLEPRPAAPAATAKGGAFERGESPR